MKKKTFFFFQSESNCDDNNIYGEEKQTELTTMKSKMTLGRSLKLISCVLSVLLTIASCIGKIDFLRVKKIFP